MAENNSKLLLSGKFDFDPKEILDEYFYLTWKKQVKKKIFDSILEKILDKNDIFYIDHNWGNESIKNKKRIKRSQKWWTKNKAWNRR